MSATTPVLAAKPPASAFAYLLFDPWIALSWFAFIGAGLISVLMLLDPPGWLTVPTTTAAPPAETEPSKVIARFLGSGYCFWSLYFGMAASWRRARGVRVGLMYLLGSIMFSLLGGGIYQFFRRWWHLAHGRQPAFIGRDETLRQL